MPTDFRRTIGYSCGYAQENGPYYPPESPMASLWAETTVYTNGRIRRVKPPDLLLNQTPLPLQYTRTKTALHMRVLTSPANGGSGWHIIEDYNRGGTMGYMGFLEPDVLPTGQYINKLRNKVKDVQGVNVAEDCFEMRQTAKLATDIVKGVTRGYQFYKALRKGDVAGAQKFARGPITVGSIANAHLAASWGVVPLVNTLQSSVINLNSVFANSEEWRYKCFRAKSSATSETFIRGKVGEVSARARAYRSERAVFWVKFRSGGIRAVQFGNVLELGWNLLTLSCIADWFIPISDSLSALDALSGVETSTGTVTIKTENLKEVWYTPGHVVGGAYQYSFNVVQRQGERVTTHERILLSSIPGAVMPRWDMHPSLRKLALATSVLVGLHGKSKGKPGKNPLSPIPTREARKLAKLAAEQRNRNLHGNSRAKRPDPWESNYLR